VLHCARADFAAAAACARRALAADGELLPARLALCEALRQEQDVAQLVAALTELRTRIEREYVANSDWEYFERAQTLLDRVGRAHWRLGDEAAAAKAWREPPVRKTPYSNPFGYWRNDWGVRWLAEPWLAVREPARALAALETEFLLREQPPWRTWLTALERTGRTQEVIEFAWKRLLDPIELYGVTSGEYGWIYEDGNYRQSNGMSELLVDLYRRHGRLDELRARATALAAQPASRRQAEQVVDALARLNGDWRVLAERRQKELDARGDHANAQERFALVKLWCDAGEHGRALAALRRLLDFDSEALRELARDAQRTVRRPVAAGGRDNPFAFSFDGSSEGWSYWSSWQELEEYRMRAAGLLLKTGQVDEAREVETDLLRAGGRRELRQRKLRLAEHYVACGVPLEAVRLLREVERSPDPDVQAAERGQALAAIGRALREAGDVAGRRAVALELRQLLEQRVAQAPGPHAFALRSELAGLLLEELGDPAGALTQLDEWLLRHDPASPAWRAQRALALLRKGDAAAAIAELDALSEHRRLEGGGDDPPHEVATRGLALVRAGQREEGAALLVQSLPKLGRKSSLRAEVEAALQEQR
jgi:hypothetical protein